MEREQLDELADDLDEGDLYYLQQKVYDIDLEQLKEKIQHQAEDADEIFAEMTREGYYRQEIEISPHLSATFRTISSQAHDNAVSFAAERSELKADYGRKLARRRLAYSIIGYNDKQVGDEIDRSLYDIQLEGNDPMESLEEVADKAYSNLQVMPDPLFNRLSQAFGVWETVVDEQVNEADQADMAKK